LLGIRSQGHYQATKGENDMTTETRNDLAKPEGLSAAGEKAYAAIAEFLKTFDLEYTGGCKAFYSPKEWKERGEDYGLESELIVVHDGGDLASIFNLDYGCYDLNAKMDEALRRHGVWMESCTCWYTAIYEL